MKLTDNKEKQASLDLAEDSRETDWNQPSFVAEIFKGNFNWNLIHPFPYQTEEDKKIGDEFLVKLDKVLRETINPDEVDKKGEVPKAALDALAAIGAFGMKIPKKYDGLGFSVVNYNRAMSYVGSYCGSTAVWLSAHQSIGAPQPLKMFGTEEQKQKFLPRLAKGAVSAFALTEPNVGSDPANMITVAELSEDGKTYTINGEKIWITNGPDSEIMIVMARTKSIMVRGKEKKQISAFIMESDSPGFEVAHNCEFLGIRGISNGLLKFKDVKVPAENLVGKEGQGLKIALATLNTGRLTVPAAVTGMSKIALTYTRDWVKKRVQWGQPIGKHQSMTAIISRVTANTFAMEAITWLTSAMADNENRDIRLEAAMAKYFCTEKAWDNIDDTLQVRGGRGYETESSLKARGEDPWPIERMLRDTRINRIIEGTSEIMQLFIAREAMDVHVKYIMGLMSPRKSVGEKVSLLFKAIGFYSIWYPKQWLRMPTGYRNKHLSNKNRASLKYISKTSKKLARNLFHTMGKYQTKLEKEQVILGSFVDIGTDLFAMATALAYAEHLVNQNPSDQTPNEVVDMFCIQTKDSIKKSFQTVKHSHRKEINNIGKKFFDDELTWMEDGVLS
jgi:alkylation response protein AidB-like acyl-CoA dehydrogenase